MLTKVFLIVVFCCGSESTCALSIGTESVTQYCCSDTAYTTAFGYPYCRQLCYRRFASSFACKGNVDCKSRSGKMGKTVGTRNHVPMTCIYSKCNTMSHPQLTCTLCGAQHSRRPSHCYFPICAVHDAVCDAAGEFCRSWKAL